MLALYIGAAIAAFVLAATNDYLEARHIDAVTSDDCRAAERLSVAMYLASILGLVALVKVGFWLAIFEVAGLVAGTRLAMRWRKRRGAPCSRTW